MRWKLDRGAAQSMQWALLTPLLTLAILGLVQGAVILQARQSVREAAFAGAQAEALYGAPAGSGAVTARRVAESAHLREVHVSTERSGQVAVVTVSALPDSFFNIGQGRVSRTAIVPLEVP